MVPRLSVRPVPCSCSLSDLSQETHRPRCTRLCVSPHAPPQQRRIHTCSSCSPFQSRCLGALSQIPGSGCFLSRPHSCLAILVYLVYLHDMKSSINESLFRFVYDSITSVQVAIYLARSIAVEGAVSTRFDLDRLAVESLPECSDHFRKPAPYTLGHDTPPACHQHLPEPIETLEH